MYNEYLNGFLLLLFVEILINTKNICSALNRFK